MSSKYNLLFILAITSLYIFLILKFSEILSNSYHTDDEIYQHYAMTIFILAILGMVIAYLYINDNQILHSSLNYGGFILLFYSLLNYWDFLDDSAKLIIISIFLSYLIYYSYKL